MELRASQFEEVERERVLIEQQVQGDAEYRSGVARVTGGRRSCHIARTPGQSLVVSDSALSATSISGFNGARIQLHTRSSGKHLALNQVYSAIQIDMRTVLKCNTQQSPHHG